MTIITLPPLPKPVGKILYAGPYHHIRQTEGAFDADQLRARDLEVAKAVLEGAANLTKRWGESHGEGVTVNAQNMGRKVANNILAVEVKHHE
jgi:hypothetical protein